MGQPWDVVRVAGLLVESAEIALEHYDQPRVSIKEDDTVVTGADQAIEKLLVSELDRPEDGVYVLGEETINSRSEDYLDAALNGTCWIVDPIDGTAPYSLHIPTWGISIALSRSRRLVEGAIYLPVTGELLISDDDKVLYGAARSGVPELSPLGTRVFPEPGRGMIALTQWMAKYGRLDLPNPVQATGSAVFALVNLCLGRYEGYIGSLKLWDFAGAVPLLANAGVRVEVFGAGPMDRIEAEQWRLDPGPRRWKARGPLIAGRTDEMIRNLTDAIAATRR